MIRRKEREKLSIESVATLSRIRKNSLNTCMHTLVLGIINVKNVGRDSLTSLPSLNTCLHTLVLGIIYVKNVGKDSLKSLASLNTSLHTLVLRWKHKLQKHINIYRKELSQTKQHLKAPSEEGRLQKKIKRIHSKYRTKDNNELRNIVRELEGKIPALTRRIRLQEE